MKHYVGIDLGTTNSAITTYDGENVRLYKSPEQNDVTPSAIFVDKRGNRYFGQRAYENAARSPDNAAKLFKRLMGTSTPDQPVGGWTGHDARRLLRADSARAIRLSPGGGSKRPGHGNRHHGASGVQPDAERCDAGGSGIRRAWQSRTNAGAGSRCDERDASTQV